ncbi:hypothetical protein BSG1_20495 [Bacillus sp. SG-1]|nr:hypothetical protein BSG1_20495 [Bacillus sp. SG-1]
MIMYREIPINMVINNLGLQKLIAGSAIKGLDIKAIGQSLKEDRKFYCKCRTLMNWQGACVVLLPLKRNENYGAVARLIRKLLPK